jgi:hypothetical protein
MSTENQNSTVVEQVDINLDDLLGTPGAENIMLPQETKPSVFTKGKVDTTFLDSKEDEDSSESAKEALSDVLAEIDPLEASAPKTGEEETKTTGRPKVEKSGVVELMNKLIEKGQLVPFDDDKPLEEYSIKDFEELLEANIQDRERSLAEKLPSEFFGSLPEELQAAAAYVMEGGTDLKSVFRALSQVEEVKSLDPNSPSDQERIVREYLTFTKYGSAEEIEEEIESLRDRDELEKKALKFKPKLEQKEKEQVARKIAQQEDYRKKQEEAAQFYMHSVYETLKPGEVNGIKLDKKTQSLLYNGLTQPSYPSISGQPTNLLGHLLEKYQFIEPNHGLIAEALWLLSDPDSYKSRIAEVGKSQAVEKTARQLKTEQVKRTTGTPVIEKEETVTKRLPRNNNFFKR